MRVLLNALLTVLLSSILFCFPSNAQNNQKKSDIIENYKGARYYMHFVQAGETVQSIAKLYGVSNVEILKSNPEIASGLQPNKIIRVPVVSDQATTPAVRKDTAYREKAQDTSGRSLHIVQAQETWYGIARQYKVPVKELIKANPDIDTLKVGMSINIPKVSESYKIITGEYAEHTVMPKETLYSLSKQFETTVEELIRLNPSLSDGLKIGQVIMVPVKVTSEEKVKIQVTDTTYIRHEVMRKETLYSISKLYGVDQNDILKANPSLNGRINKGDVLRIPKIIKEIRPAIRPDTTINGRPLNVQAKGEISQVPCTLIADKNIQYNVALLIPMQLEMVDSISVSDPTGLKDARESVCFDFIEFYEGAVIAADSMASRGMKVKIHVYDVDFGDEVRKTRHLLNNKELGNMDLIIGPFFAESFNLVADFAKAHKIPVINPLSRRAELIKDNDFVVKMQPSAWSQYNALAKYIKETHSRDNVVLIKRNQDENKGMMQTLKSALSNDSIKNIQLKEVTYSTTGSSGITKSLSTTKPNFLVIGTSDKAVLPAILRDLAAKVPEYNIEIVGLPEWEEMELDYNYLIKLHTHFFKAWFVDYNQPPVKNFLRTFRSKYIAEPEVDKYAYLGYDATFYFLSALYNYGDNFLNCIGNFDQPGLSNDLKFIKNGSGGYENCGTSVFKYTDFTRQKLN